MTAPDPEALFEAAMTGTRAPHAWLIAGPRGPMLRRFAERAAWRVVQDSWPRDDDDVSDEVAAHPDIDLVERGLHEEGSQKGKPKRDIDAGQIRALRQRVLTRPTLGERRAAIIDSIDDTNETSANGLLKILEEPPASATFLLITHRPGRILPTIRSRCRMLTIRGSMPLFNEAGGALGAWAQHFPHAAASAADLDLDGLSRTLGEIAAHGDPDNRLRVELAQSLTGVANRPKLSAVVGMSAALLQQAASEAALSDVEQLLDDRDHVLSLEDGVPMAEDPATIAMVAATAVARLARLRRG